MESFDLRGAILAALKTRPGAKLNTRANPATFCCVRHDDATPSAWIGDNAWGCYACDFTEHLGTLADELSIDRPKRTAGLTVAEYADWKGFSITNLTKWSVRDGTGRYGDPVVVIPYLDANGTILREKHRTRKGTFWGTGHGTYLYGLNMLAKCPATEPVILVEGESDCHAAWSGKVLAVGVPGATQWRSEWAAELGSRPVYIWQEPDEAGAKMVARIAKDIPTAKIIAADPGSAKDIADLYKATGKDFKAAIQARMSAALPVNQRTADIPFDAILGSTLDAIKQEKLAPIDAVPTPFTTWNAASRGAGGGVGLARGWHITLAGNTGQGKSLVALNIGARAIEAGEHVAFVSLEMTQSELATRLLSIVSGEPVRWIEQGNEFDVTSFDRASRALTQLHDRTGGTMYVNRHAVSDLDKIADAIRFQHEVNGCRFVIVDYMQLAFVKAARTDIERITLVSSMIRRLAAELKIVTVGLSQYNRETSKDRENMPSPQGLHGGSALENDSHQVLLLDHTSYTRDTLTDQATMRLLLAKNRHGPQAIIPLRFKYRNLCVVEDAICGVVTPAASQTLARGEDRGEAWEQPDMQIDTSFDPSAMEADNAA